MDDCGDFSGRIRPDLEKYACWMKSFNLVTVKVRNQLVLGLLGLLGLLTGCAPNHENILFSDEAEIRVARADAMGGTVRRKLGNMDELKIEQAVFTYLLGQHLADVSGYSAVFLQAEDAQVAELMRKFPDHIPPIKPSESALIQERRAPLDKDTGKPALVLSADLADPNADGTVDVAGRWSGGDTATGFYSFHLRKVKDDWQIDEVK
jgi:hypothetical protein